MSIDSRTATAVMARVPPAELRFGAVLRPWLWFLPALLVLLVVIAYPTAIILWLSLQKTRFYEAVGWAGFANYNELLRSPGFLELSTNSLIYTAGTLAIVLPVGLVAAVALQELGLGGKLLRTLLLLPWTLSQAVIASFWLWLLNPSYGPVAYVVRAIGFEPGLMLGDLSLALPLVILITAWWSFPYAMVMLSAALQSVPRELYEAVDIDGGGRFAKFRHVVLPHVRPTLVSTGLALGVLYMALITLLLVLTGGGPLGATNTWSLEIFLSTFKSVDLGPAAVLSIVVLAVKLALGFVYVRATGRMSG